MDEHRTGVQRRTLIAALLAAGGAGALSVALVGGSGSSDSVKISDVESTTTTVETTVESTSTTAAPATAAPVTAAPSIEQRVDDHEQRITQLEETTTTAPTTTSTPTTSTYETPTTRCYQPDMTGDCDPNNNP